jgi:hypothetical protein
MLKNYFHEKISFTLSFLILINYFLLNFNTPHLLIKINFLLFITCIFIFFFKNLFENPYLKIFFIFLAFLSLGIATSEWDPRSIWLFQAKKIFYEGTIFSVSDNYASFSHNDYPKIASSFASSLGILLGRWNEVFPKLAFLLMFLPPLIFAYSILKKTQYVIFLTIIFFTIGKFLFNGWMDGLVAVYFGFSAFLYYILIIEEKNAHQNNNIIYYIAFCFFVILTLIKNEGAALLLILFSVGFLFNFFTNNLKKKIYIIFFLSLSFLPIIAWKFFCFYNDIESEHYNFNILSNFLPRIYELNNYKLISYFLLLNEKFLISLVFFLFSFWLNWDKRLFIYIIFITLLYLMTLFFIFMSTPYDLYWQLNSTAARVVRTLTFFLSFMSLYNLKIKINY